MTAPQQWDDVPPPGDDDVPPEVRAHERRPTTPIPRSAAIDVLTQREALERWEARSSAAVVSSGIEALDNVIGGGFPVGQIAVILGYSGSGKSELARQCARHAARNGHGVVHVDVELGAEQIVERDLAQASGISPRRLRDGLLTPEEAERLRVARTEIAGDTQTRTICPGGPIPLAELEASIVKALDGVATEAPSFVVIDSLQRIAAGAEGDSQRLQTQHAMWFAASLARRFGVAVVLVSEQARAREGGRPSADSLLTSGAESRAIEYVADVVVGLVQRSSATSEDAHTDTATWERRVGLAVAKNRHGSAGHLADDLVFRGPCWEMTTEPRGLDDLEERIQDTLADGEIWAVAKLTKKIRRRKAHVLTVLRAMLEHDTVEHVIDESGRPVGWRQRFPNAGTRGLGAEVPKTGNPPEPVPTEVVATPQLQQGMLPISEVPKPREPPEPAHGFPCSPYVVGEPEPEVLP